MSFFMLLSGVSLTPRHVRTFESVTLFYDSLSVLSTLSAPLPYLTPKSLFDTQSLLNTLSDSKVIRFQWIPVHSSLPDNDLADSLAKVGASLDPIHNTTVSLTAYFLPTTIPLHQLETYGIQSGLSQHQIPPLFFEELILPHSALSRLRCNGHSTLLGTLLHRIGRSETLSCSNCGSDLFYLVLDCPVLDPTHLAIFGPSLSILVLSLGSCPIIGLRGVDSRPHPHPEKWVG